jgi:hypothetical protein
MEPLPHRRSDGVDVLGPTVLPSGPVLVIEGTLDRWLSPPRSRGVSRAERPLAGVGRSPIPSTTTAPWGAGVSWGGRANAAMADVYETVGESGQR